MEVPSKKTILVVDDDPGFQRICAETLRQANYEVLTVGNGVEALRVLNVTKIDLVLTDIFMPEKDGLETIQILRRQFTRIPVIGMSGGGSSGQSSPALEHARILGARGLLTKPFQLKDLLRLVDEAIGPA